MTLLPASTGNIDAVRVRPDLSWVASWLASWVAAQPVAVFVLLSAIFGLAIIAAAPPLRGPDETAHFLRAYGVAQGDIIPSAPDGAGRKGIFLPAALHREFSLFESWQLTNRGDRFSYRRVFAEYLHGGTDDALVAAGRQKVFVPYAGSEGYSPAAYLPQAAAAALARAANLDFLATFYLMRVSGLAAMTAVLAYAIALAPALQWPLVAIGLLPSVLYGRAVINADAAAFAYSLVVVAMFLRAAAGMRALPVVTRSAWMLLCVLSKPPNVAFILLDWMRARPADSISGKIRGKAIWRTWRASAMATLPALAAALVWAALSSADVAAWRLVEITGASAREFAPGWKLRFMLAHPLEFPAAVIGMLRNKDLLEFWHQVIGVLGLFDTVLRPWVYSAIGALLAATFVSPLECRSRVACALAALGTALAYALAVVLIFYLVWTPVGADQVWGGQGRYFVPVLPLIAVASAAAFNHSPDARVTAMLAIAAGVVSGAGCIDAILRTDWNF